jgi:hypothetical protein
LPLDRFAADYRTDIDAFKEKGMSLAGQPVAARDAAVSLLPLPRVPVTIVLWGEDEEFPARAELLFDETCLEHLPIDALWAAAMTCLLAFRVKFL